jgi:RNA polymerase sigma-70 factor (ECF subfamily)
MGVDETGSGGPGSVADTRSLADRVQAGDIGGFRELYERVAPSLYTWARVRSGQSRDLALDPEDLLQETWMRAVEGIATYDRERASFRAWIFGIAKHVAYDHWRKLTTRREWIHTNSASASNALDSWPAIQTSVMSRLTRDESMRRLIEQVATLDPEDRMLLVHCGMEGAPCVLVATRIGLSAEAATKRWQRLRARLAEQPFAALLEL